MNKFNNEVTYAPRRKRKAKKHFSLFRLIIFLCLITGVFMFLKTNRNYISKWNNVISYVDEPHIRKSSSENSKAWNLILVNKDNPLPDDYNLELTKVTGGESVDSRIFPALSEMLEAAEKRGYNPRVVSGYRTTEKQKEIMNEKISELRRSGSSEATAKKEAEKWVAVPGTSEHQLGLAVDINGDVYDVYIWLEKNAHLYGFIKRYPENKTDITGISNEPWHYRYVGVEAATEMYEQDLCLEEYLEEH